LNKNEFGVPEWCIYPNKEVMSVLNSQPDSSATGPISFEPEDVVEAESVESPEAKAGQDSEPRFSNEFQAIVEQCVRPLVDEVKAQALALAEKDRIIEEQSRQLRLLPDFQRKAEEERQQAENERKEAELRALEVEALNKQIAAMEEEKESDKARLAKIELLESQVSLLTEQLQKPWWKKLFGGAPANEAK
jgi:hypothetical protein